MRTSKVDKKLHIAGPPEGSVQKCQRCRRPMMYRGHAMAIRGTLTFWPTGALVLSDGRGNWRVMEPERAHAYRECLRAGRRKAVHA